MSIKWTDEELAFIEAKAEVYTVKQIASILKRRGYQRTPVAIYLKLNNLGYSARPTLDNYSCQEIAQVLQLNFSTVTRWVKLFNSQFAIFALPEVGDLYIDCTFF
ncbi:MAG: hypothetical protein ACYTXE_43865 [Nostoc sp.]